VDRQKIGSELTVGIPVLVPNLHSLTGTSVQTQVFGDGVGGGRVIGYWCDGKSTILSGADLVVLIAGQLPHAPIVVIVHTGHGNGRHYFARMIDQE
jgi:hypothetical protein